MNSREERTLPWSDRHDARWNDGRRHDVGNGRAGTARPGDSRPGDGCPAQIPVLRKPSLNWRHYGAAGLVVVASVTAAAWFLAPTGGIDPSDPSQRSAENTSELQSLMRNQYSIFCL